ncbi:uncharacterized protein LOC119665925 [Teleopsis dalmanni]|uniref:uncharacterized protein LOC119665925 n=1 Tax=Teleopsis dalmanni TaxID=139649 RepID=UPI0018CF56D5|nr:uncharacterized protein LOC119665925 [Teleopsis dalmanni]
MSEPSLSSNTGSQGNASNNNVSNPVPNIDELRQQRASSKGSLTRIKNIIDASNNLSPTELECRLGMVESYYKQASYYQGQIERLLPQDTCRSEIDELYVIVKSRILNLLGNRRSSQSHEHTFSMPQMQYNRLPKLRLPRFDGKYLEYKNFINSFTNLVHSDQFIPPIEKFNHLLSCLSGEALSTIKSFQVTEENYENISSIFEVDKISKADSKQLRHITDTISALYNSLQSLGSFEKICDAIIIHLTITKVDQETKKKWDEYLDYSNLPSWKQCCAMLDKRCQQLDAQTRHSVKPQSIQTYQPHSLQKVSKPKQYSFAIKNIPERSCTYCSKLGHNISTCINFIALPLEQRRDQVQQHQLCFNCLSNLHTVSQCSSKYSCRFCKQRHHTLLHKHDLNTFVNSNISSSRNDQLSNPVTHATSQKSVKKTNSTIILATALILIKDSTGTYQMGRALLDSCSQVNFITDSLARALNLKRSRSEIDIVGVGSSVLKIQHNTQTTIRSRITEFETSLDFLISKNISSYHPDKAFSLKDLNIPSHMELADPEFNVPKGIDMLLGAEAFFLLLTQGRLSLGKNLPILQNTEFGWIVSGRYALSHKPIEAVSHCTITSIEALNKNIEKMWQLEDVSNKRQKWSEEQIMCEQHFIDNVSVNCDGRIMVKLPFKNSTDLLGNSKDIALRRFYALEKKLEKNIQLKEEYSKFMKEYEELGHMSLIHSPNLSIPHYYIPHHCVLKSSSESTKLRVVFDASFKTASQVSLNDILAVGPTIQNELLINLLRFPCHKYGLMADITKMYRQIMVHHQDRNYQLIFWRNDKSLPVSTYMLNIVTYGTAAAPFLAIRSLSYAVDTYPVFITLKVFDYD